MTITVTPIQNSQTFGAWLSTTNRIANIISQNTVTTDASIGGSVTTGNAYVNGHFGAGYLYAENALIGGNVSTNSTLNIVANVAFKYSTANLITVTANSTTSNLTVSAENTSIVGNTLFISATINAVSSANLAGAVAIANTLSVANAATFSDVINVENVIPLVSATFDLGSPTNLFNNTYTKTILFDVGSANSTQYTGTANNANNLGGVPAASYVNTSGAYTITGVHTHQANILMGNTTVNTQLSNSTVLISNSTSTTTLGLTDLRIGNTSTNVVISNTVSNFGGNVSISGVANVTGNVTLGSAAAFVGNGVYITTVNATNITTGTLPMAQLGSNVVNSTGAFTIGGVHTHTANITMGNSSVNTQLSNASILISNSTTTTAVSLDDIRVGNTTTNVIIANTVSRFGGNVTVAGTTNSGNLNLSGVASITGNLVVSSTANVTGNLAVSATGRFIVSNGAGIEANGSLGSSGQVLSSNGTGVYWSTQSGAVTSVASGNGITGGPITSTGTLSIVANNGIIANTSGLFVNGNTGLVVNSTGVHVNASMFTNTSGSYTITGLQTFQANLHLGNSTVNTQLSNATILLSNSTSTTTLGLASLMIGNTATNVVIANTTSTFGGNVSITGSANAANVTAALFTGNLTGTASNATNLNSQPGSFYTNATNITTGTLPWAQAPANTVNTSGTFTITGLQTFQANLHVGNSTVNTQISNSVLTINNSNTAALNASSIGFGNATVNAVYGLTTVTINGATIANSTGANNAFNLGGVAAASYVNTSGAYTITGIHTHQANITMGNTTVNTQLSNSTILISNATSTTTLGLADLRIGNTTTNVIIANTTSTFGGNVSVTSALTAATLTITGNVALQRWTDIRSYVEVESSPTISAGTLTLDLANSMIFDVSLNANITTLTLSNVPSTASRAVSFVLVFTADGTLRTVAWPASFRWPGNTAPSVTSTLNKRDVFTFMSTDNGTSWNAFISGQNI